MNNHKLLNLSNIIDVMLALMYFYINILCDIVSNILFLYYFENIFDTLCFLCCSYLEQLAATKNKNMNILCNVYNMRGHIVSAVTITAEGTLI